MSENLMDYKLEFTWRSCVFQDGEKEEAEIDQKRRVPVCFAPALKFWSSEILKWERVKLVSKITQERD